MAPSLATLNGVVVTTARVSIPAHGCWWAEVEAAEAAERAIEDALAELPPHALEQLDLEGA